MKNLDKIAAIGTELLTIHDPVEAQRKFNDWVSEVSSELSFEYPNSGLSAEWAGISSANIHKGSHVYDDPTSWTLYQHAVQSRLTWLGRLPQKISVSEALAPQKIQTQSQLVGRKEVVLKNTTSRAYIDPARIDELKKIQTKKFDFSRLIRLCEELNICFATECYLGVAMLQRAIIDHIPPIFSCTVFAEVANNYAGSKSFKDSMKALHDLSRKISDGYLHEQIRQSESLPNAQQIDFSSPLDALIAEIIRISKIS